MDLKRALKVSRMEGPAEVLHCVNDLRQLCFPAFLKLRPMPLHSDLAGLFFKICYVTRAGVRYCILLKLKETNFMM